ncbi:acylneuraminate cytidylyltransferase [Roseibium salinum]|uniref:N-acylneuraminate cytidylyltransferase n=1 Tax=Roseibium salinum TaxID=1604349 RepID=A0ABT3R254_9HYPH|nr:acylneuraminate cytidylyltransferase [Roseibium sp. DSM 29163]MCX2723242.1 acylneuraminate cytidylyltransferase [Roseibium sp. DSM 29163]MDN3718837.1 acylneuraminate cytidylyltransferase [Roseibium salinum]
MKIVAAIPARGGSVGLPGKNIRPLNGIPLVGRTIRAARGSRFVSEVFVSSDSDEILSVGEKYGAKGVKRPIDLSGPTASSESALIHLLKSEPSLISEPPDILVFLQCTAPFTQAHHVDQVVETLLSKEATSAISVVDDHGFYWEVGENGQGVGINHDPTKPRVRRQDISARYRENGAVYAMRVPEFLQTGNRYCGKTILVPVDSTWIEIDTSQDWDMAEAFIRTEPFTGELAVARGTVSALVTGFEGVHTDNSVFVNQDGTESIVCNRYDEIGMDRLIGRGVRLMMISGEQDNLAQLRARKLAMEYKYHPFDRMQITAEWLQQHGLDWSEIAYVGADLADISCMEASAVSAAPRNAPAEVKSVAKVVLDTSGGSGALRELSDLLISTDLIKNGAG